MSVKRLSKGYRCSTNKVVSMMQEQNGKCVYCYKNFNVNDKYLKPTLDHIQARSTGGSETDEKNVCIACFNCNMRKGNISVEKFLDGYICWSVHGRELWQDCESITIEKKVRGKRMWYHKFIGYSLR